jgi:hypothetical protein
MEAAGIGVTSTLKFKAASEPVKKRPGTTRRLLKARTTPVRAEAVMKNHIHMLLTAEGL